MIDVVNVHKSYRSGSRSVEALRGVSCRIDRGRFAFIVGPSGSGKSTLLYLIGAIDRPSSGEIVVDGQDLVTMSEACPERLSPRPDRLHLPVVQPDQQPDGARKRAGPVPAARGDGRAAAAGRRSADGSRPGRSSRPPALPAFRRRTATGGDRPGAGQAADPGPGRRADRRARLEGRRRDLHDPPRLQESFQTTLVVVTHDRRFITPDDLVLEIQDGQLANGNGNGSLATGISSALVASLNRANQW